MPVEARNDGNNMTAEGDQRQVTFASNVQECQLPCAREEQGALWFETVTYPACWEDTQSDGAKAALTDRGVKVPQNRRVSYPASARDSGIVGKTCVLTNDQLMQAQCMVPNGKVVDREWIAYSPYLLFCV